MLTWSLAVPISCSFLRFAFRALFHFYYLTSKPIPILGEHSKNQPYTGAIIGSNVVCAMAHVLSAGPAAGEATRGYLHGGLIIDFVGQKGPTSKICLLALDGLIWLLQMCMLAVVVKTRSLKMARTEGPPSSSSARAAAGLAAALRNDASTQQDHDAEEQGRLRSDIEANEGIELRSMFPSSTTAHRAVPSNNDDREEEMNMLLSGHNDDVDAVTNTSIHPFDIFYSGQVNVIDLHLVETARNQFWAYQQHLNPP